MQHITTQELRQGSAGFHLRLDFELKGFTDSYLGQTWRVRIICPDGTALLKTTGIEFTMDAPKICVPIEDFDLIQAGTYYYQVSLITDGANVNSAVESFTIEASLPEGLEYSVISSTMNHFPIFTSGGGLTASTMYVDGDTDLNYASGGIKLDGDIELINSPLHYNSTKDTLYLWDKTFTNVFGADSVLAIGNTRPLALGAPYVNLSNQRNMIEVAPVVNFTNPDGWYNAVTGVSSWVTAKVGTAGYTGTIVGLSGGAYSYGNLWNGGLKLTGVYGVAYVRSMGEALAIAGNFDCFVGGNQNSVNTTPMYGIISKVQGGHSGTTVLEVAGKFHVGTIGGGGVGIVQDGRGIEIFIDASQPYTSYDLTKGITLQGWLPPLVGQYWTTSYGIYADTSIDHASDSWFIYSLATSPSLFSGEVRVPDDDYGIDWDNNMSVPTKNAVYDKINTIMAGGMPVDWNGTRAIFYKTAITDDFRMELAPVATTGGYFKVGALDTSIGTLEIDKALGRTYLTGATVRIGDPNGTNNGTYLQIVDAYGKFIFECGTGAGVVDFQTIQYLDAWDLEITGNTLNAGTLASFEIPNNTNPSLTLNGQIAVDTSVTDFSHGILKYYGGEQLAVIAVPVAALTTPADGSVVKYNATNDEFELGVGGMVSGSSVVGGGANRVLYENAAQVLATDSTFTYTDATKLLSVRKISLGDHTAWLDTGTENITYLQIDGYMSSTTNGRSYGALGYELNYNGTGTGANLTGFGGFIRTGPSAGVLGTIIGASFYAAPQSSGQGAALAIGMRGVSGAFNAGGAVTTAEGFRGGLEIYNGGSVGSASLFKGYVTHGGTGSVTNLYGLNLSGWTAVPATTSYGIYMDATIDRGSTEKWALYSLSASPSLVTGGIKMPDPTYTPPSYMGVGQLLTIGETARKTLPSGFTNPVNIGYKIDITNGSFNGVVVDIDVQGILTGRTVRGHLLRIFSNSTFGPAANEWDEMVGYEASIDVGAPFGQVTGGRFSVLAGGSGASGLGKLTGVASWVNMAHNGVTNLAMGVDIWMTSSLSSPSNIITAHGVWIHSRMNTGVNVESFRGITIGDWLAYGGTIDNSYAIYIDNTVDLFGTVSKHAIYSLSTSPSKLMGSLGIGAEPSYPLDVLGNARIQGNMGIGGANPATSHAINFLRETTAAGQGGILGVVNVNHSTAGGGIYRGVDITVKHNVVATTNASIQGMLFQTNSLSGSTVSSLVGVNISTSAVAGSTVGSVSGIQGAITTSGTVTSAYGLQATIQNFGATASLASAYGLHILFNNLTSGASVGTFKGINFDSWNHQAGTTVTNNYLIYAGAAVNKASVLNYGLYFLPDMPSYHVGKFGIGSGTSVPSARLQVRDTAEQFRIEYDGSNYYTTIVNSTGQVTFDAVGSAARFVFSDKVQIGSDISGTAQVKTMSVQDSTTEDYANLAHFNATQASARASFMLSNNSSGDWPNNLLQFMVHGSSAPGNFYLPDIPSKTTDALYTFITTQGGINGLALMNYGAVPLYFGTNNAVRMSISALGIVNVVGSLTVADEEFSSSWNGNLSVPTKNALYPLLPSGYEQASSDIRKKVVFFDDLINPAGFADSGWSMSHTQAGMNNGLTPDMSLYPNAVGVISLRLNTVATNAFSMWQPQTVSPAVGSIGRLGGGLNVFTYRFSTTKLSDGTDTYTLYVGVANGGNTVTPTRGCFFRYTHSVNGGKWEAVCVDSGGETATDTGVTVTASTTMKTYEVLVNAAATEAKFYIDGTLVATVTTNIPTGSTDVLGGFWSLRRSAGTTATTEICALDYVRAEWNFTTPR